jgi:nicotinamidase/pyrazinamidase
LVILGLATDYCVKETALDGARLGFDTTVLDEGIRAVNLKPDDGENAIRAVIDAGVHVE